MFAITTKSPSLWVLMFCGALVLARHAPADSGSITTSALATGRGPAPGGDIELMQVRSSSAADPETSATEQRIESEANFAPSMDPPASWPPYEKVSSSQKSCTPAGMGTLIFGWDSKTPISVNKERHCALKIQSDPMCIGKRDYFQIANEGMSTCKCCGGTQTVAFGPDFSFYKIVQPTPSPTPSRTTHDITGQAKGDPHLQNMHGQRFDLMQAGRHTLVLIPRGADSQASLLRVDAEATRKGKHCTDMYFEQLNVTGRWVEKKRRGGYRWRAGAAGSGEESAWTSFGAVDLKVVHGSTKQGVHYLNFHVRHLGRTGLSVGGLLGEDDHTHAAAPDRTCHEVLTLLQKLSGRDPAERSASVAEASS